MKFETGDRVFYPVRLRVKTYRKDIATLLECRIVKHEETLLDKDYYILDNEWLKLLKLDSVPVAEDLLFETRKFGNRRLKELLGNAK